MGFGELIAGGSYLRAYYRLEDVSDSSGNSYNLTNNNSVSFASGRFRNGADFGSSGTNKGLIYTGNVLASSTDNFDVSFWFKLNNTASSNSNARFFQMSSGTSAGDNNTRCIYNISGGNITIDLIQPRSITSSSSSITFTADSNWHFVIARINNLNSELYIDGDLYMNSGTGSGTKQAGSTTHFGIGNTSTLTTQGWIIIDEVAVYATSAALGNSATRAKIYTQTKGRFGI